MLRLLHDRFIDIKFVRIRTDLSVLERYDTGCIFFSKLWVMRNHYNKPVICHFL